MNNFHYALSLLETMYGIEMEEDEFEEIAIVAWNHIGNKRTRMYKFSTCMDNDDNTVKLPCNFSMLEAVSSDHEDWKDTTIYGGGDPFSYSTEQYTERLKDSHNPLYASGKLIHYELSGDTLYFDRHYGNINVLYKGEVLDDDGLPEITDKEALAIATYCAYISKNKEGIKTNNYNIMRLAESLRRDWLTQADQARTSEYLSQNDWDNILDARTAWNRKSYGKTYKMYK